MLLFESLEADLALLFCGIGPRLSTSRSGVCSYLGVIGDDLSSFSDATVLSGCALGGNMMVLCWETEAPDKVRGIEALESLLAGKRYVGVCERLFDVIVCWKGELADGVGCPREYMVFNTKLTGNEETPIRRCRGLMFAFKDDSVGEEID